VIGPRTLAAVTVKEFRQIGRDRRTLMILLFVPAFVLLLYGYALNFDIRNITLALQDNDRSTASREVVSAFVNSGYFDLVAEVHDDAEIVRTLDRGDARAVLIIPAGFGREAASDRPTSVQLIINGDNANTASTVMGYGLGLVSALSARYELEVRLKPDTTSASTFDATSTSMSDATSTSMSDATSTAVSGTRSTAMPGTTAAVNPLSGPLLTLEPRVWYNPELRSALFLVPGLIAYIAMLTAVVSTALSIVREKEVGTMEQIRMSPIGALPFVVGKTVPYFVISLISSMSIVGLAMLMFDLPMRGSWLMLLLSVSLFLVGALAFGLLISTIADNQQVAFQMALLTSYLPTLMLSGFIFPIQSMPAFLQGVTYIVPARYFLIALRAIVLKGVGIGAYWQDLAALAAFAMVILGLASLRLRRQWA
jgi:ABC-2 type transport system permease protein